MTSRRRILDAEQTHIAYNYAPLPVVLVRGERSWVYDVEGNAYLDFLAGYSALIFGHQNPRLIAAARRRGLSDRVTLKLLADLSEAGGILGTAS